MNQEQLQTARAALWHQTAPLETADAVADWLNDLGLCLFLPRHTQLPAPAPSLVEAIHGAGSAAPPAAALERAGELTTRLVDEGRAVPLNLLGTYSEQADFLVTPEMLPWVAAIRGDRQWNAAPGGRTSPLVVRMWQVLDREGEATAVQLRELLGRELTEAAVLRALVELWTSVRAMPVYRQGEPTQWTLLKNRFPSQMATGANTAQTTALSALLSIYLRSAVAATAEEAEVFLSPLTARSRIREVIHGMMAARQLGSMSVGSQTLLFVPGSLPEHLPMETGTEEKAAATVVAAPTRRAKPFQREFAQKRRPARPAEKPRREPRPPFPKRGPEKRGGTKPWERRPEFRKDDRPGRQERPPSGPRFEDRREKPSDAREERRPDRKPWQRRENAGRKSVPPRRRFDRQGDERRRGFEGQKPSGPRFGPKSGQKYGRKAEEKGGFRPGKDFGRKKPGAKFSGSRRPEFPPKGEERNAPRRENTVGGDRRAGFGKGRGRSDPGRTFRQGKDFKASGRKNFRKANPGKRNPRKNRSQEENPE